jgi:hypothetical protein
MQICLISTVLA